MIALPARLAIALGVAAALALSGCSPTASPESRPVQSGHVPTAAPAPSPTPVAGSHISKVLVFILENHSLSQMKNGLPYTFGIARQFGYASHYSAITHPSLPNYLAISGGSSDGVTNDALPSAVALHGQSVFGQAIAAGKTAGVYADAMKHNCETSNDGTYIAHHNPWAYYRAERAECQKFDVPLMRLASDVSAGALPTVGMVVPDVCHDAHSCPMGKADAWMKVWLTRVMTGPDWQSGHLAVVVTADEDDRQVPGNSVLTTVAFLGGQPQIVKTPLTHYSLTRLYEEVAGVKLLAHAATARSLSAAFGFSPQP